MLGWVIGNSVCSRGTRLAQAASCSLSCWLPKPDLTGAGRVAPQLQCHRGEREADSTPLRSEVSAFVC